MIGLEGVEIMKNLNSAGFKTIKATFDGSGDSGYVEDIVSVEPKIKLSKSLHSAIADLVYDVLEEKFGGWEINEGSQGTVHIYPQQKTCDVKIYHNIVHEELEEASIKVG